MDEFGNLISDEDIKLIKNKLIALKDKPLEKYQRNLIAISYINYLLNKLGIKAIIVGGHAVELYTAGNYTTVDIDLVLANREAAKDVLESIGFDFTSDMRHWYHEELAIPIEIPDHTLAGSLDKVIEIEVEEGFNVYVIGIEDLILDRARSALYWGYNQDRHWALSILAAQFTNVDFDYLKKVSKSEDKELFKLINELIDEAQEVVDKNI